MYSTTELQSNSSSRPGRKSKRSAEDTTEPAQKPKKVNSEIRKQQNRIASRNYREKRKRKLQYLQRLLRDDTADSHDGTSSETRQDSRSRSVSAEYMAQAQSMNAMRLPPTSGFHVLSSTTGNIIDPVLATTEPYHSPYLAPSAPFTSYEPSWSVPIYSPPLDPRTSTWNGSQWVSNIDFPPQAVHPPQDNYPYTPPHTQSSFEQLPAPFLPSQGAQATPHSDYFAYGRSHGGPSQGISSVSLQSSPPYSQVRFSRAP